MGITALFHVIAAVVLHTPASAVVLGVVGVVTLWLTVKRLEIGLCIALFEIVIGAHGHLVDYAVHGIPVSLRMIVFCAVIAGWCIGIAQKRWSLRFVPGRDMPFVALTLTVIYGVIQGLALHNGTTALIDDANSYVTLGYLLPLACVIWTQENRRLFLTTLFAGTLWVALFTLFLTFVFTHISQENIWAMYVLVRDSRMFEVTLLSSPLWLAHTFLGGDWYFRVFSQAQIFAPLYLLILMASVFFLRTGKQEKVPVWIWVWFGCFAAAFIQSLSRSFVVGFIAGLCTLGGFWLLGGKSSWQMVGVVARRKIAMLGSCIVAAGVLWVLVSLPLPTRPDLTSSPFYRGDQDNTRALAVSSRWNMLDPMLSAVAESPVLGRGFGKELTYISDDPRIREMSGGTGEVTTYRFEWGFLDIWMKMGVFGLVAYAWIGLSLVGQVFRTIRSRGLWSYASLRESWLEIGLASGVVMLFAVHMFTPYLNHPIGLFYLLLAAFLIQWKSASPQKQEPEKIRVEEGILPRKMTLGVSAFLQKDTRNREPYHPDTSFANEVS